MLTGYGPGYLQVNDQRLHCSLIVTPQQLIENWTDGDVDSLADAQLERLRGLHVRALRLRHARADVLDAVEQEVRAAISGVPGIQEPDGGAGLDRHWCRVDLRAGRIPEFDLL